MCNYFSQKSWIMMEAFDLAWKEGTCPDLALFNNAHLEGAFHVICPNLVIFQWNLFHNLSSFKFKLISTQWSIGSHLSNLLEWPKCWNAKVWLLKWHRTYQNVSTIVLCTLTNWCWRKIFPHPKQSLMLEPNIKDSFIWISLLYSFHQT